MQVELETCVVLRFGSRQSSPFTIGTSPLAKRRRPLPSNVNCQPGNLSRFFRGARKRTFPVGAIQPRQNRQQRCRNETAPRGGKSKPVGLTPPYPELAARPPPPPPPPLVPKVMPHVVLLPVDVFEPSTNINLPLRVFFRAPVRSQSPGPGQGSLRPKSPTSV